MATQDFLDKVRRTINKYQLLKEHDRVLVGFSGGPDSTALVWVLNELKSEFKLKLIALHINHGIRKKAADADQKFSVSFCKKLKIPIKTCKINTPAYAKRYKFSIESAARILRYQCLFQYALRLQCKRVALGHHANDNAETVLLNLIRGTGVSGLKGIAPIRPLNEELTEETSLEQKKAEEPIWLIRPLIEITRQEILEFLKTNNLAYCEDLTNLELGFRRNYLRHKIIPELEKINPQFVTAVLRTSEILRMYEELINAEATEVLDEAVVTSVSGPIKYIVDIPKINKYNQIIKLEVLKKLLPRKQMNLIKSIEELALKPSGSAIEITKGLWAWREYDKLFIGRKRDDSTLANRNWPLMLNHDNEIKELGMIFRVREIPIKDTKERTRLLKKVQNTKNSNIEIFDKDKLNLPLYVRLRRAQDRIRISDHQTKKLKELFIDQKIPLSLRRQIPIVADQNNILWVVGLRRAFYGLIDKRTKTIIEIKVEKC
ncbi:MAG: tRNA lysidine(34) synthetase TilS [candidate division WOR-3 bacterium]